jgi:hypothetical protein
MKYSWLKSIPDLAASNSGDIEGVSDLVEYQDLFDADEFLGHSEWVDIGMVAF